jgi:hypothetical protein
LPLAPLRDRNVDLLILDDDDHIPILIIAEDLGARLLEAFERLGGRVTVGVVRPDLDDRYLGLEVAEEEGSRRRIGAVVGNLQKDKGSEAQNGPFTSQSSPRGVISRRSLR